MIPAKNTFSCLYSPRKPCIHLVLYKCRMSHFSLHTFHYYVDTTFSTQECMDEKIGYVHAHVYDRKHMYNAAAYNMYR